MGFEWLTGPSTYPENIFSRLSEPAGARILVSAWDTDPSFDFAHSELYLVPAMYGLEGHS